MMLGTETVNCIVDTKDLSSLLLSYIEDKTRCYYSYAQFNRENYNKIGLQVYKDFYTSLAVVYENEHGTHWVGIGNMYNMGTNEYDFYINFDMLDENVKKVSKEIKGLLKDDFTIMNDCEYEELQDAIASGDSEWVESIVGDRDLTELI